MPLAADVAESIRAKSLAARQDEFFAADAAADAALEELADFASRAQFWKRASIEIMADLTMRADAAEARRRQARQRLLWEWCESAKAALQEREDAA